jgi:DNA primase catalytic core
MARFTEAELEQLKNEVSVERLVESAGIALNKSGKDRIGLCPFHADGEPSLVITPGKNLWHCFSCQIGGGAIDWVMKLRGVSFRHAVELLKSDHASSLAAVSAGETARKSLIRHSTVRSLPAPIAFDADDQALLNQVVDYYHQTLLASPEALAYLASRGLAHPELISRFRLGYANRTLGLRLPFKQNATGEVIRTRLQQIGIYRESGHEHFNGSLIVPVIDDAGNVTEIYGRKIRDDLRKGTPKHLYLPGAHRGVWNESALADNTDIILCEALIDAMSFWCAGFTHVTASYGVEGFTADHVAAFQRHGTKRVLIAYDRDEAGDKAADKLAPQLIALGIECLRVRFPQGMDANSTALKLTPAQHSLGLMLRQAEWMGRPAADAEHITQPAERIESAPVPAPDPASPPALAHRPLAAGVEVVAAAVAEPELPSAELQQDELSIGQGEAGCQRHWRVRGWQKNRSPESMRVNLQVRREGEHSGYHVDTLDLYAARSRAAYIKQAAVELGLPDETVKRDLGCVLLKLETLQDELIRSQSQPKSKQITLTAEQEKAALTLLQSPDLIQQIVNDMARCGVVGEASNLLAGYLAAVSRKLDTPLAILIQSTSAAGKSSLMEAVLAMVPPEDKTQYSAMTGQSLFYLGETDMQHKILAIAEEEGVRQAAYALKLLQSDGELTMASTGKDEVTGNLVTKQYTVKGPVMLMLTTTAIDVDEELMNRCLVLTVNESREQTKAIHARQRAKQTLQGLLAANDKAAITEQHQNAQRLLQPVLVVNPYADQLTFLDDQTRTRRDHMKYLTLIRAIALLHQHQREVKTIEHNGHTLAYIEATKADIALANNIAHEVLGRTLDELPPQTRRLLILLQAWVIERSAAEGVLVNAFRFNRKALRDAIHWGDTQLKLHLSRLAELEYIAIHRRGCAFDYELVYDGKADAKHLCGLIAVEKLTFNDQSHAYDDKRSGLHGEQSASGRSAAGGWPGAGRTSQTQAAQGFAADSVDVLQKPRIQPATSQHPVVVMANGASH